MLIHLGINEIADDLREVNNPSAYAPIHYASLLRIVLSPSVYELTDEALIAAVVALRKSETNPSCLKILNLLQQLAPLS